MKVEVDVLGSPSLLVRTDSVEVKQHTTEHTWTALRLKLVSRPGLAVMLWAGKQKDLSSNPLRLSFLFRKVVVCGHCLVTLSLTINETRIAVHLNAGILLVVTV